MKYIIMCGGNYPQWDKPRQLTHIGSETIVEHTIDLLRKLNATDISISATDLRFSSLGVPMLQHNNSYNYDSGYWVDAFYPTDEPTTYLFGDVWYSEQALRKIISTPCNDVLFFGTKEPYHDAYWKNWEEPLAFKVVDHTLFNTSISVCKAMQDNHIADRMPISWELYRVIDGININQHSFGKRFIPVYDFAIDVDTSDDINRLRNYVLLNRSDYLVSVIIPVYNQQQLVIDCLDSLPKRNDIEIIVVNDGSTDDTLKALTKYPRDIVIVNMPSNAGPGVAMNMGLNVATGKYILRLDSDDKVNTKLMEDIMDYHLDGKADMVFYNLVLNNGDIWYLDKDTKDIFCGATKFTRREFIGNTRFPAMRVAEDLYFYLDLKAKQPTELFTNMNMYLYNHPRKGSLSDNGR